MTLPFSDKPEKSSIYQDVKTTTLQDLTPDQFDQFKERMFAEGVNGLEDEYRRLILLGLASDKISLSGPLDDAQVVEITDTTGSGNPTGTLFQPEKGQVWQITGAATRALNANNAALFLTNGSNFVEIGSESSQFLTFDPFGSQPVYVTNDVYLFYEFNVATGNCGIAVSLIRVR